MEQYQSMAESIEKLKRPLIYIALISGLTHLLILGTGILLNRAGGHQKYSTLEACLYGIKSIFENTPDKTLLHPSIIKDIGERSFKIDKLKLVKANNPYSCDVVVEDLKGHRSYKLALEKNSKLPHFFRIIDIKEQKIVSPYQWKELL